MFFVLFIARQVSAREILSNNLSSSFDRNFLRTIVKWISGKSYKLLSFGNIDSIFYLENNNVWAMIEEHRQKFLKNSPSDFYGVNYNYTWYELNNEKAWVPRTSIEK